MSRAVGLCASLLVLAQILAGALAARANTPSSYALQRSLVNLAAGGGALVDPPFNALLPMFVATYGAALIAFAAGLALCWQGGRLVTRSTGAARLGGATGRRVMLIASVVWIVLSLLAYVVLQLDGTVSWLVGTLGAIVLRAATPVNGTVYSVHPTAAYIAVQAAALLVQLLLGALVAIALGGAAGRLGARSVGVPDALRPTRAAPPSPLPPV